MPVSYWDNGLNAEPAAKYFVSSEKEGKELTGQKYFVVFNSGAATEELSC